VSKINPNDYVLNVIPSSNFTTGFESTVTVVGAQYATRALVELNRLRDWVAVLGEGGTPPSRLDEMTALLSPFPAQVGITNMIVTRGTVTNAQGEEVEADVLEFTVRATSMGLTQDRTIREIGLFSIYDGAPFMFAVSFLMGPDNNNVLRNPTTAGMIDVVEFTVIVGITTQIAGALELKFSSLGWVTETRVREIIEEFGGGGGINVEDVLNILHSVRFGIDKSNRDIPPNNTRLQFFNTVGVSWPPPRFVQRPPDPPIGSGNLGNMDIGEGLYIDVNGTPTMFIKIHNGVPSADYVGFEGSVTVMAWRTLPPRQMHSTDVNDYANSDLHAWLNNASTGFLSTLDTAVRDLIHEVRIPFRPGSDASTNVSTGASGLQCRVFLLSAREVGFANGLPGISGGNADHLPNNEGVRFEYFLDGNQIGPQRHRRVALDQLDMVARWWLRTPRVLDGTVSFTVLTSGSVGSYQVSSAWSVRPTFTLPSTAIIQNIAQLDAHGVVTDIGQKIIVPGITPLSTTLNNTVDIKHFDRGLIGMTYKNNKFQEVL